MVVAVLEDLGHDAGGNVGEGNDVVLITKVLLLASTSYILREADWMSTAPPEVCSPHNPPRLHMPTKHRAACSIGSHFTEPLAHILLRIPYPDTVTG